MKQILEYKLSDSEAAFWWLGQAGYIIRSSDVTIIIDPYLSDAAAKEAPELTRLYSPPLKPSELTADIYIVTHDHLDHLDPEIIPHFISRDKTQFIAPRQAAKKLSSLGIPSSRIKVVHAGETILFDSVEITGVFALATSTDVIDTTGYFIRFKNGCSFYHTSDTEYHPLVVAAAPKKPDVMAVPINGKWRNPGPEQALAFALSLQPEYILPCHYDLMELNSENPKAFKWFCRQSGLLDKCLIPERMKPFVWKTQQ
jgi:L-ascorbate 6-phosphate lactonase